MKNIQIIIVLVLLCSVLIACERQRISTREDFIDRALELASFLTDNYTEKSPEDFDVIGDSILFEVETGDTMTFLIRRNYIRELEFESLEWYDGASVDTIHEGFDLTTQLVAKNSEQSLSVTLHHGLKIHFTEDYWTDTYAHLYSTNGKPLYDIATNTDAPYEWKETEDTIFITYANMTCTLKRNVGIVKFTCDEHSWELVQ